jgi:hypothetical protein
MFSSVRSHTTSSSLTYEQTTPSAASKLQRSSEISETGSDPPHFRRLLHLVNAPRLSDHNVHLLDPSLHLSTCLCLNGLKKKGRAWLRRAGEVPFFQVHCDRRHSQLLYVQDAPAYLFYHPNSSIPLQKFILCSKTAKARRDCVASKARSRAMIVRIRQTRETWMIRCGGRGSYQVMMDKVKCLYGIAVFDDATGVDLGRTLADDFDIDASLGKDTIGRGSVHWPSRLKYRRERT